MDSVNIRRRWRRSAGLCTLGVMGTAAAFRLAFEVRRLTLEPGDAGAVDLGLYYEAVQAWFHGQQVYSSICSAVYPPATYMLLWPFLGWRSFLVSRFLWAGFLFLTLGWLVYLCVRECGARTLTGRILCGLLPLGTYGTTVALGNGQLTLPAVVAVWTGIALLRDRGAGLCTDLAASGLFLAALSKPTVSVPFLWIVLFVLGRIRPVLLAGGGYLLLTLTSSHLQHAAFSEALAAWSRRALEGAAWGAVHGGYMNVHTWLGRLGLARCDLAASVTLLGMLGVWMFLHRNRNPWPLLGLSAICARIWTYHRVYDDMLILVPMAALCQIAQDGTTWKPGIRAWASLLLGMSLAASLVPARLANWEHPWDLGFVAVQTIVWLSLLVFLLVCSRVQGGSPPQGKENTGITDHGDW